MVKNSLLGKLLVANPLNPKDGLDHSVIMIVSYSPSVSMGLRLNLPQKNLRFGSIFHQLGLSYSGDDPVYHSGNLNSDKIQVVHSLDWRGFSTVELAPGLGLTQDLSVITALSRDQGPEHFRACAGLLSWIDGSLDQQLNPLNQTLHKWELTTATVESVFAYDEMTQWHYCVEATAREQVNRWFNLFQG